MRRVHLVACVAMLTSGGCDSVLTGLMKAQANLAHPKRTVDFHVIDGETGEPIANAPAEIGGGDSLFSKSSGTTDGNGHVRLRVAREAGQSVDVASPGYMLAPVVPQNATTDSATVRIYREPPVCVILELPVGFRGLLRLEPGPKLVYATTRPIPLVDGNGLRELIVRPDSAGVVRLPDDLPCMSDVERPAKIAWVREADGSPVVNRGGDIGLSWYTGDYQLYRLSEWLPDRPDHVAIWEIGRFDHGTSTSTARPWLADSARFVGTPAEARAERQRLVDIVATRPTTNGFTPMRHPDLDRPATDP